MQQGRWIRSLAALAAVAALAGTGLGQLTVDFETLDLGQLDGQGGWRGWDGLDTGFAQIVDTHNCTPGGARSVELRAGADSVLELTGISSGRWNVETRVYAPAGFQGRTYFIVLNRYAAGGPYEWAAQIAFDGDGGKLVCDCGGPTPVERPLVTGAWVDLRLEVDLDGDRVDVYYNTADEPLPIATYPWSAGPLGGESYASLAIAAVDLYPDALNYPHVTELYVDDLSVAPPQPQDTIRPTCFGDGTGAACGCGNESAPGSATGCLNGLGVGAALAGSGLPSVTHDSFVLEVAGVRTQPGLFFQGNALVAGGSGVSFGDGIRCCGNGVVRLEVVNPPPAPEPVTVTSSVSISTSGPAGTVQPGDTLCYQYWYRDPAIGPCGSAFNLSNAVACAWSVEEAGCEGSFSGGCGAFVVVTCGEACEADCDGDEQPDSSGFLVEVDWACCPNFECHGVKKVTVTGTNVCGTQAAFLLESFGCPNGRTKGTTTSTTCFKPGLPVTAKVECCEGATHTDSITCN